MSGRLRGPHLSSQNRPYPGGVWLVSMLLLWVIFMSAAGWAQTFNVLHTFKGEEDGQFPTPGLARDAAGNLYGSSLGGGSFDMGTIFELDADSNETVLHSYWGGDGLDPGDLVRDGAGNLFGTTGNGGTPKGGGCRYGCGTAFKLDAAGTYTLLHAFTGALDGGGPEGPLVRDEEGNFYGVTAFGGDLTCDAPYGCGLIFKLVADGRLNVLYVFSGGDNAEFPSGGLVRDDSGNLYGVAAGGTFGAGSVYKLTPAGKETVLYSFTGGTDGGGPNGALLRDAKGNFYGTAAYGGDPVWKAGAVFKIDKSGKETVLHAFKGSADGERPAGGLVGRAGRLYGVTSYGGGSSGCLDGCGTVFEVDQNGHKTVLHTFQGEIDGAEPLGPLLYNSGNLYGTATLGGDMSCLRRGCGVVFEIAP